METQKVVIIDLVVKDKNDNYEYIIARERVQREANMNVIPTLSHEAFYKQKAERIIMNTLIRKWKDDQRAKNPQWTKRSHQYPKAIIL